MLRASVHRADAHSAASEERMAIGKSMRLSRSRSGIERIAAAATALSQEMDGGGLRIVVYEWWGKTG